MESVTPSASNQPQNFRTVIPSPAPAPAPVPSSAPAPDSVPDSAPEKQQFLKYQKFLKGNPKELGTVQIMIGTASLLFGTVLTIIAESFIFYTGTTIWASVLYIISGALTVSTANLNIPCMIKASLVMNVISAVAAGISLVLLSFDVFLGFRNMQNNLLIQSREISGVLLVFCLLQLSIAVFIVGFGYVTFRSTEPKGMHVVSHPDSVTTEVQYTLSAPELYQQTDTV